MPFTPSHAVVALPFVRSPLVPAAVAVGAMTPDLPLFLRGTPIAYEWTHDFRWIALTAILALALLLIWRCVLRPAGRELAPRWLARRLPSSWDQGLRASVRETFPSTSGVFWLLLALLVGVASHIAWDLFTHEGRAGVVALPGLDAQWGPLQGFKWLQYGSSVLGLVIIAIWAVIRLRRAEVEEALPRMLPSTARIAWWFSLPLILVIAWTAGYALVGPFTPEFTYAHLGYLVLPPACAVWGVITLATCVGVQLIRYARRRGQPQREAHSGSSRPHGRGAENAVGPPA